MAYASTTGMNNKFGTVNVTGWADMNNDGDAATIAARKAAAIAYADAEVDAMLRDTHYRKPLVMSTAATPTIIADVADTIAGCWLKNPRGQDTFDEKGAPVDSLTYLRSQAYATLQKIKTGEIRLDAL